MAGVVRHGGRVSIPAVPGFGHVEVDGRRWHGGDDLCSTKLRGSRGFTFNFGGLGFDLLQVGAVGRFLADLGFAEFRFGKVEVGGGNLRFQRRVGPFGSIGGGDIRNRHRALRGRFPGWVVVCLIVFGHEEPAFPAAPAAGTIYCLDKRNSASPGRK
ncbi:hypothetical protein B5P43_31590 [Bacillus sp. SRB_336]|nr:hypothetical protein B5P43_31590 [Bacillus sp. SRB_336]